jgi:23S rRNA pseudouridine1911/1915/1917 synthase
VAVPQDIPLKIVYADEDLIIVDKPAGLVTHPAPGHSTGTLVNALLYHCGQLASTGDPLRPGLVHRLDRETSGLLAVALSPRALKSLAAQLKDRTLGRTYLALSWGTWPEASGTLSGDIGRNARDRQRMAVVERGGREAITHYEVVDDLSFVQLCRVKLATGRTHQIRVHFAHHGHPVVGDPVYGDDRRAMNVRPVDRSAATRLIKGVPRQFLHAAELELRHPADGRLVTASSPLPPDLAGPLARLHADVAATA